MNDDAEKVLPSFCAYESGVNTPGEAVDITAGRPDPWKEEEERLKAFGYPSVLVKAAMDPYVYFIRLATGERFRFSECEPINKDWVHLKEIETLEGDVYRSPIPGIEKCHLGRGIDVRLDQIIWVVDCD